jgi:hypothetical protein
MDDFGGTVERLDFNLKFGRAARFAGSGWSRAEQSPAGPTHDQAVGTTIVALTRARRLDRLLDEPRLATLQQITPHADRPGGLSPAIEQRSEVGRGARA